jgi:hypothetical protein
MTSKDLQADLQADLLADMVPSTPEPVAHVQEPPLPPELTDATPALSLQWTPLRWARPRVTASKDGLGKAVRLGPLKLEFAVKE